MIESQTHHPPGTDDGDGAGDVEGDGEGGERAPLSAEEWYERFCTGPDRYIEFIEYFFGVSVTQVQKRLMRSVANNQRTLAVGGNGPGKSYSAALLNGAFLYSNPDSICMPTSGTYSVLDDTLWKPLKAKIHQAQQDFGEKFPGRTLENPPRVDIDDEWFLKAVSPRNPEGLEGRHASGMLITIEEADKPDITMEHIDSAESMITDDSDRMLVIANPPEDEANIVHQLMEDERWNVVQFSSFESHNVRVDMQELDAPKIPGLVDLETVRNDWERWNQEEWPGAEAARTAHEERRDLDVRWYRRRAGVIPPEGSAEHRPINVTAVQGAWSRGEDIVDPTAGYSRPIGVGIDVARSSDHTVMAAQWPEVITIPHGERGSDLPTQISKLRRHLDDWPRSYMAVDAVGHGSGEAGTLRQAYPNVSDFQANATAVNSKRYYDHWAEALDLLGDWLESGGAITNARLREELLVAARNITFTDKHYSSRDATVLVADSKDKIKESLGRSPDYLDAAAMAVWAAHYEGETDAEEKKVATVFKI